MTRTAATCSSSSSSSSSSHFSRLRRLRRHHRVGFPRRSFSAARRTENGIYDDKDDDDHDKSFEKFVTIRSNAVVALGYDKKTRVRGLFATREIKNETEIFRVSLRKEDESVFTDDKDDDDESSSSFFKGGDWSASLAKQILKTKTKTKKKKMKKRTSGTDEEDEDEELKTAYVHALPKEIIGIANKCCFYDGADELVCAFFEATGDHDAKEELMKYRKQISSSRSRVEEKAEEEDEYGWALSQVFSRTFRIEDVRGRRAPRRVMIPIVDLLNHSSVEEEVNVTWRVTEDLSAFIVEAKRDVGKDEELILSYGERNDQHFLLFYGFVPSANPCNSVVLWEDVDECLNWYQNLCGADENDAKWDSMKYKCKRTLGLLKKKDEGDFIDDINEERRRFILSPNAKVDNTTLLVLNEISGDNDMAVAAVRVRAEEILSQRFASENDANVERIFKQLIEETHMDEADIGLLRAYRNRKRDILREIV
jgi:hypothetical protein